MEIFDALERRVIELIDEKATLKAENALLKKTLESKALDLGNASGSENLELETLGRQLEQEEAFRKEVLRRIETLITRLETRL